MKPSLPQAYGRSTTLGYQWALLISLLPVVTAAGLLHGPAVYALWGIAVVSALLAEEILRIVFKNDSPRDLAPVVWSTFLVLLLPRSVPWPIAVVGPLFAILVIRGLFARGGTPWINPALAAWAFLRAGWPEFFPVPSAAATSASGLDVSATTWLNGHVLSWINVQLPFGYFDQILGLSGTSDAMIVESGNWILLLATIALLARDLLPWEAVLAYFLGFAVPLVLTGNNALAQVFSGGLLLNLFFLSTDPSTRPMQRWGGVVFGLGAGLLSVVVRVWGGSGDAVGYAVLAMNLAVPWIDQRFRRKKLNDLRWT